MQDALLKAKLVTEKEVKKTKVNDKKDNNTIVYKDNNKQPSN